MIRKTMFNQGIPEDAAQKLAEASEIELLKAKVECKKYDLFNKRRPAGVVCATIITQVSTNYLYHV